MTDFREAKAANLEILELRTVAVFRQRYGADFRYRLHQILTLNIPQTSIVNEASCSINILLAVD